ncbi:hypothetical protein IB269_27000 [Delftia sp. DLF01]|uniref:hypothetical protein n=1 Tax=Delftia sp. DLF01 TaxID=2769279 RepID=UPI001782897A|nr:hypothetical protein [Delftia sp. DLF01]MBD9585054.1 hypothetical protein [Delftia sp. DLF01]
MGSHLSAKPTLAKLGGLETMQLRQRAIIPTAYDLQAQHSVVVNGHTLQSSCQRGLCTDYDDYKRRRVSKVHIAVDTLVHLLAVQVMLASEQVQQATRHSVEPVRATISYGIELPEVSKCLVLLPRRWVVERNFERLAIFLCMARDYE